jgi:hypothetical protein
VPIICILIMQLCPPLSQYTSVAVLMETSIGGFLSIWLGTVVFSMFGLQPTLFMVQLTGLFFS